MDKRVVLCATDIGGAKNLAVISERLTRQGVNCRMVKAGIETIEEAARFLKRERPLAVICGTTRYLSPERLLTAAARQLKIRTIVVLDEWFNYRMRFEDEHKQLKYLPDIICCQDELARNEAQAEGLPSENLLVTGSAYLSALNQRAYEFKQKKPALPYFLKDKTRPIITFLSETHSADYGNSKREAKALGEFIGYSETEVREDIAWVLKRIARPCTLIEKLHPSDKAEYKPLGSVLVNWLVLGKEDLWPLLLRSDLVVGMRSLALLEAVMLGRPAVSYQPNLKAREVCTAVRLGLVESIHSRSALYEWVKKNFDRRQEGGTNRQFSFARDDALDNITALIEEKCQIRT